MPGKELAKISAEEKFTFYDAKLLCYTGDTMPLSPDLFSDAKILIHDSTFLNPKDRNAPLHSTAQEAFDTAAKANVEKLILCHISPRYHSKRYIYSLLNKHQTHGLDYTWIPHGRVFELS